MSRTELLEKAVDFIVEREEGGDYICEMLHESAEEEDICATTCENLNKDCVMRFLRRYGRKEE